MLRLKRLVEYSIIYVIDRCNGICIRRCKMEEIVLINKNNMLQNRIAKESIFTALMILMEQKNFNEISITEVAKKAVVSRMAFYRNYNLMEDMID